MAVIAVDPSSPFTGGALLGDRIRMGDLAGDPGVFVRSMASRGAIGGLAHTTGAVAQALDAVGYDVVLIETVGAGQAEVDIVRLAHTVVVVEAPGLGDDIQALKAGLLEIADIFVVNKADRPEADLTARRLEEMLHLALPSAEAADDRPRWTPPVLKTIALQGQGIADLVATLDAHRQYLQATGLWAQRERQRLEAELEHHLRQALLARWRTNLPPQRFQTVLQAVLERRLAPEEAAEHLLDGTFPHAEEDRNHALR